MLPLGRQVARLDRLEPQLPAQRLQRPGRPPGQVMRHGVGRHVGDLDQGRGPGGDRGDEQAAGLQGPDHRPGHRQGLGGVLQHLEGADRVIGLGVSGRMAVDVLAQDLRARRLGCVGIDPGVARVRHVQAEGAGAAADVEHLVALRDQMRRGHEFGARRVGIPQQPLVGLGIAIEGRIERLVPLDHRIEEGQAAGRLPEADRPLAAQEMAELDPAGVAPQLDQESRRDLLDQPDRRLARHGAGRRRGARALGAHDAQVFSR